MANATVAPPQAGVLDGVNPIAYSPSNPISLFIIQAIIVICLCQLLHYPLRLLNQPRVIAEVIGGIILGPSVMMRIPGFQNAIFPTASIPVFSNVANLGLLIFLFLIALEVDIRLFTHNWKAAVSVGLAGMILPFGLGYAIAWGIYHQFQVGVHTSISFPVFGLFIGTALGITAFPVLCRILSELNLLRSNVGVTTLAAGIGNDVTGWVLLALCVALVNNSSGLAALWALLCCIGWALFLVFIVRPPFIWILGRTGSLQNGPTQGMVALTMLMVLASAFFTGIIGVHPIFGAFLMGLICPHDGGFAIKLTEKIEDLISVLFNPLYFALSGLNTNLGLLNDGITWGYIFGIIACAFFGKITGGTLAARANKLLWRESLTIGCLMSCKGLVELIVLNIGLQAGILSQTTFTMFVVMALITTVATTPLTKALYPPWYQRKVERWRRGEIDWDGNPLDGSDSSHGELPQKPVDSQIRRLMVHLRLDSLPSLFTFITLLSPESNSAPTQRDTSGTAPTGDEVQIRKRPLEVHGLRVIELTDRTSSVMHLTEGEDFYSIRDPVVNAFRTFSQLHDVAVSGRVAVVPTDSYAETLMTQASETSSDFALIPWGEYGSVSEDQSFPLTASTGERFRSGAHLDFIAQALAKATRVCNTGIFIDNGFGGITKPVDRPDMHRTRSALSLRSQRSHGIEPAALPVANKAHHIFLPFFGGADDRVAIRLVLQLARNQHVTASIVRLVWPTADADAPAEEAPEIRKPGATWWSSSRDTPDNDAPNPNTNTNTNTKTQATSTVTATPTAVGTQTVPADPRAGQEQEDSDTVFFATMQASLPAELSGRVSFAEARVAKTSVPAALKEVVVLAQKTVGLRPGNAGDVVVLGRRNARFGGAGGGIVGDGGVGSLGLGGGDGGFGGGGGSGSGGNGEGSSGDGGGGGENGNPELRKTVGAVAEQLVVTGVRASLLVVQAGGKGLEVYA